MRFRLLIRLERDALAQRSEGDAVGLLMGGEVRAEVEVLLRNAMYHSLDVERKHNNDKRSEGTKVMCVCVCVWCKS